MPAITDVTDLQNISLDLAGSYYLANDIDASGGPFTPLGTFTGILDGKDFVINDLTITLNAAGAQKAALFLRNDGTIKDLGIEDCVISVTSTNNAAYACALVCDNRGSISGCWSTGSISANCGATWAWANAAGLVNTNNTLGPGTITESYSTATCTAISIGYANAGGLVCDNWNEIRALCLNKVLNGHYVP